MTEDSKIPLLEDLISKGQLETQQAHLLAEENQSIEIVQDQTTDETEGPSSNPASSTKDELESDASLKELIIDEEIRMILDRHMDRAYEEIIRLLNHKIS